MTSAKRDTGRRIVWRYDPRAFLHPHFILNDFKAGNSKQIGSLIKEIRTRGFKASTIDGTAIVGRVPESHVDGVIEVYRVYAGRAENKLTIYQWLIVLLYF